MVIWNSLILTPFFSASLLAAGTGAYLLARYRTRLALWCGLLLLSLALELGGYGLHWGGGPAAAVPLLSLVQVVSYSLFCVFWLLFVLTFTRQAQWLRPSRLIGIVALPLLYVVLLAWQWAAAQTAGPVEAELPGSLINAPFIAGTPGLLFLAFAYGVAVWTFGLLVRLYLRSSGDLRKWIRLLLAGVLVMMLAGILELAGVHPLRPISLQQAACALIAFLAVFMVSDLRFRGILVNAYELVVDQMPDGVLILDQQDRLLELNPAARQILGLAEKQPVKGGLAQLWPAGAALLAEAPDPAGPARQITLGPAGQGLVFELNAVPLLDVYREPAGRVILLRNVTGRERLEQTLQVRAQELLRANSFLAALAEINIHLQTATDPAQINTILGSELGKLGLVCFIAQLDPASQLLSISYFSVRPERLGRIEKLLGVGVSGLQLDREQFGPLYDILASRQTSFQRYKTGDLGSALGAIPTFVLEQTIRLGGLEGDMPALILPLMTAERTLGLMGVWGRTLGEADIIPFRIFAGQAAHVMEKALLYEAELHRSAELARVNSLVLGLSQVASVLGTTANSERVFETLGRELNRASLSCAVLAFDPHQAAAVIQYLSFTPETLHKLEGLLGLPLKGHIIPQRYWPGDRIFRERAPVWYPHPTEIFGPMFPMVPEAVARQAYRLLGFGAADQLCILPLLSAEQTIGAIAIWGSSLKPSDSLILRVFASQVSSIVETMANYEKEVQRTRELARSNGMVMALSRVAAQLDTTTDLNQVFTTLGRALKNVRVSCMVGILDDAHQTMKIAYLSISPDLLQWLDRLGAAWSNEIAIPRALWPTDKAITEKAPYWDPDPVGSVKRMFPLVPKGVFNKIFGLSGMAGQDQVCYLPMISEEHVLGILAVWGPDLRQEDVPALSVFANQVATAVRNTRLYTQAQTEILERKQAEARTQAALEDKEVLLKEIHHRVKNNLQVISSLLNLQTRTVSEPQVLELLRDSQNRVRSMALVHEKLYRSSDLARIDLAEYAESLAGQLLRTYSQPAGRVTLQVQAAACRVDVDTAVPCGLILNELVSNALKHAFPGDRTGTIVIALAPAGRQQVRLRVADDGVGFPAGVDFRESPSLGLQLVNSLTAQLDGTVLLNRTAGTEFLIEFPAGGLEN